MNVTEVAPDGNLGHLGVSDDLSLVIRLEDAPHIFERMRESKADERGRAFLLNLDQLIVRLGARWDVKQQFVWDYLKSSFEQKFQEPNWCVMVRDNAWLALPIAVSERVGALSCAQIWFETVSFFVGQASQTRLPLYEVIDGGDQLILNLIDLETFFDRDDPEGTRQSGRRLGSLPDAVDPPSDPSAHRMIPITRATPASVSIVSGVGSMQIICSLEPVFELKRTNIIGHRLESLVIEQMGRGLLDAKAMTMMSWEQRELVDLTNIVEGMTLLRARNSGERKHLVIVPAAFSTFAASRIRQKIIAEVSKSAAEMRLKVLFELRDLKGVPPHRVLEIVSLLTPFCMAVIGHAGAERRAILALNGCGLRGYSISLDGNIKDDRALCDHFTHLVNTTKVAYGTCMVHGLDNVEQLSVARVAGVGHASLKAVTSRQAINKASSCTDIS